MKLTPAERFWSYVKKTECCWEWIGCLNESGYGILNINRRLVRAHRYSYEIHVGAIPEGLTLDHLCRNPACVRPDHLEPVTLKENCRRGVRDLIPHYSGQAAKTHCPKGHPYNDENTYYNKKGHRTCRSCLLQRCDTLYKTDPAFRAKKIAYAKKRGHPERNK